MGFSQEATLFTRAGTIFSRYFPPSTKLEFFELDMTKNQGERRTVYSTYARKQLQRFHLYPLGVTQEAAIYPTLNSFRRAPYHQLRTPARVTFLYMDAAGVYDMSWSKGTIHATPGITITYGKLAAIHSELTTEDRL